MALQIADITKDREDLMHLLDRAYHDIYVPAFPDPDERESLEKFKRGIREEIPGVNIAVNILGENLNDKDKAVIKGISVGYYYQNQNVGLLAYNAIAPEAREKGLGKIMVQSRINSLKNYAAAIGKKIDGVFIEVNDPQKVAPENDSMNPADRVGIFTKWGARKVPIPYVQPPVDKDSVYCDYLLLLNYPVDGRYAPASAVEQYLRGIYREDRLGRKPEEDAYFREMTQALRSLPPAALPDPNTPVIPGYMTGAPEFTYLGKPPSR